MKTIEITKTVVLADGTEVNLFCDGSGAPERVKVTKDKESLSGPADLFLRAAALIEHELFHNGIRENRICADHGRHAGKCDKCKEQA